jgi:uncharacterized protein (DUF433 family)
MTKGQDYVRTDEHGVLRVGASRVMLDSIVAAFDQGYSPETIRQQFPALSLEEVYGSIAYYLAHVEEVQSYLRRQDAVWHAAQAKAESRSHPVVDRLRAIRQHGATKTP